MMIIAWIHMDGIHNECFSSTNRKKPTLQLNIPEEYHDENQAPNNTDGSDPTSTVTSTTSEFKAPLSGARGAFRQTDSLYTTNPVPAQAQHARDIFDSIQSQIRDTGGISFLSQSIDKLSAADIFTILNIAGAPNGLQGQYACTNPKVGGHYTRSLWVVSEPRRITPAAETDTESLDLDMNLMDLECPKNDKKNSADATRPLYIVKFYSTGETPPELFYNLEGIKTFEEIHQKNADCRYYADMPTLALHKLTTSVSTREGSYFFTIFHAAQGMSASDMLKNLIEHYPTSVEAEKKAIITRMKHIVQKIGHSMGAFHAYHALHNDATREQLMISLRQICTSRTITLSAGSLGFTLPSFPTVTHNDLHLDNLFITPDDLHVTLIDLETMFTSTIYPRDNLEDVFKLGASLTAFCQKNGLSTPLEKELSACLDQSYVEGIMNTVRKYQHHIEENKENISPPSGLKLTSVYNEII